MVAMAAGPPALSQPPRLRLWIEFLGLYVGAPLAIALALPPRYMFAALLGFTLLGLGLLWRSGGFRWGTLLRGWNRVPWTEASLVAIAVLATGFLLLGTTRPDALFAILRHQPAFLLLIWALYPLLSALPQELIFRPLFFHRYGTLLPRGRSALLANAAACSFAHLMYWSPVVLVMTFIGGFIFARAYLTRGFPAAWVLHAVGGNLVFAVGLGTWFYSGNVTRPF